MPEEAYDSPDYPPEAESPLEGELDALLEKAEQKRARGGGKSAPDQQVDPVDEWPANGMNTSADLACASPALVNKKLSGSSNHISKSPDTLHRISPIASRPERPKRPLSSIPSPHS